MHRPTVGIIALALLGVGIALTIWPQDWAGYPAVQSACCRVGAVMGALWIAHPQIVRLPGWIIGSVLITGIVVAMRPRLLLVAVPLLFAAWILRPRR